MYMVQKTCTQLYLELRQKKALEKHSNATGKSVGQLVREAVGAVYLKSQAVEKPFTKDDPLWKFIGRGRSKNKKRDISARHDYYLYIDEKVAKLF